MSKYHNLTMGLTILSEDKESFVNVNKFGVSFFRLIGKDTNKLPKKSDLESGGFIKFMNCIDRLYSTIVEYNTSPLSKKEKKATLEKIIGTEYVIFNFLGMTDRIDLDGGNEIYATENVTINQHDFIQSCFSIKQASKQKREAGILIDYTSQNVFKKSVIFGLYKIINSDGTLYKISEKDISKFEKIWTETPNKKTKKGGKKA